MLIYVFNEIFRSLRLFFIELKQNRKITETVIAKIFLFVLHFSPLLREHQGLKSMIDARFLVEKFIIAHEKNLKKYTLSY